MSNDKAVVNFMCPKSRISKSFVWPHKDKEDKQSVDSKFVLKKLNQSEILPVSNGRAFSIGTSDTIDTIDKLYNNYCLNYF